MGFLVAIGYGVACPKPRPRILDEEAATRKAERAGRQLRAAIRLRDRYRCKCCNVPVFSSGVHPLQRAAVHHVRYRSLGGLTEPNNLVTVCAKCHAKIHAHEIDVTGRSARSVRFIQKRK